MICLLLKLSSPTVELNTETLRQKMIAEAGFHILVLGADLREISMKSDICRGALKWDLAQEANRILKDTNEAEPSECENLPLSDGSAWICTINLLNAQSRSLFTRSRPAP